MNLREGLLEVKENVSLAQYTTFKIGGRARYFYVAKNKEEIIKAIKAAKEARIPFLILGGGSNILFSEKGFGGIVIKLENQKIGLKDKKIFCGAGSLLSNVVETAAGSGLAGLEWAAGIPGTAGGAIYGNVAAFGSSMAGIIEGLDVLDAKTLQTRKFLPGDCKFSNKDSIFKHNRNLVIVSSTLVFEKESKKKIRERMGNFSDYRRKNHPINLPSAGCVFKNIFSEIKNKKLIEKFPELKEFNQKGTIPVSYLIDKSGLRGKKIGAVQISPKHANFIVNLGGARPKDVVLLMNLARKKVKEKFGVKMEEEIIVFKK